MFKRVYIEISNICNLQCSFCPVVERDHKVLECESFEKILRQVGPLTHEVCLHLMGEPTAHPNFSKIIKTCTDFNTPIQLTTNGISIEKDQHVFLSKNTIRQINFSIQSYKDNFPERPLETYLLPLLRFSKKLNKKRPEVYINFRLWNMASSDNGDDSNKEFFDILEYFYKIKINRSTQVEAIKSKRIWEKVYLHFDSRFIWPSLELSKQGESGRCHGLSYHIGIHADGTVVPCCLDKEAKINLGNCLNENLTDILSSDRALKIKKGFQNNELVEDLCQRCLFIRRFSKGSCP